MIVIQEIVKLIKQMIFSILINFSLTESGWLTLRIVVIIIFLLLKLLLFRPNIQVFQFIYRNF